MKIITFDAHLIELSDLTHVWDHILEHQPCVAFYKITFPQGNSGYFMATAEEVTSYSTSIGKETYEAVLRINS